jgi:leucyl aminopeptidase
MTITFDVARSAPRSADAVGIPVPSDGPVPRSLGLTRAALAALGFEGRNGQTLVVPGATASTLVAVGVGERAAVTAASLRTAAAALARAVPKKAHLATALADIEGVDARAAGQAVAEGLTLAAHRYVALKTDKTVPALERVTLVTGPTAARGVETGATRGRVIGDAVNFSRDLANTPPAHLNARDLADIARTVGAEAGLQVEVFDEHAIAEMNLGGLVNVNKGSVEPPRLVRLTYTPRGVARGTVALVGKGVMYDSGGISLKPSDAMHAIMKMDMSGAAAVLAAMTTLKSVKPRVKVIGYLLCTDNMPSGSAMKLGDVITIRNGKTVEIHNTDAEGRLILADGLSLAVEDGADAIVDIATLTGACMNALGLKIAGVMGNDDGWVEQVRDAAGRADERVWPLPLPADYRRLLDSDVADMRNVGGPYAGALTAGLFLKEFVGTVPWAHIDIAGPMRSETDDGWLSKGATAFGVRTFIELLDGYAAP